MRFLVVDDSTTMRRIIINTLNKLGHQEVLEASNGREGMDRLVAGAAVDMVITDWNMPEMTGIELLEAARAEGATTTIGFITTETSTEFRERAERRAPRVRGA